MAAMYPDSKWSAAVVLLSFLPAAWAADSPATELDHQFAQTVRPFVTTYCIGCHGAKNPAAQFDLHQYAAVADVVRDHLRWALVSERLRAVEMPPKGLKQPSPEEREQVIHWIGD